MPNRLIINAVISFLICFHSCKPVSKSEAVILPTTDTEVNINVKVIDQKPTIDLPPSTTPKNVETNGTSPDEVVNFATTLIGVPYKYGSANAAEGFDCSGFITYVFNHFAIKVPRSSVDFTNVGIEVPVENAKKGDLILFTGTDSTIRTVGHMGVVTENLDSLRFIHSTSGKSYGVTITALNNYYKGRFVKVTRIL